MALALTLALSPLSAAAGAELQRAAAAGRLHPRRSQRRAAGAARQLRRRDVEEGARGPERPGLDPRQEGGPARAVGRRGVAQLPQRAAAALRAVGHGRHRRAARRLLPAARPHPHRARLGRPHHHALLRDRALRPLAARRLLHHPGADRAQRPLRPLRPAAADRRGGLFLHLDLGQVAAQLRGVRLHGRARPDVRRVDPPQLPALARRGLAAEGRRHVREGLASAGLEVQCRAEDPVLARHAGRAVAVAVGPRPDVPVPDARCSPRPLRRSTRWRATSGWRRTCRPS